MKYLSLTFIIIVLFAACNSSDESQIDVSNIKASGKIIRFDEALLATKSTAEITALLKKYPRYASDFLRVSPEDPKATAGLLTMVQNKDIQAFFAESQQSFKNLSDIEMQFEDAFKHIKYYYPAFKEPKIIATFTGLANDIFVSDSLVIVSLESFIGSKAKFRPDQPTYIQKRYERQYIVPTVVHFLALKYIKTDPKDETMLAEMLFHGKSYEFVLNVMPTIADTLVMGYTNRQMDETWESQDLVYAHFIDNQLFYEKNPFKKDKYLIERPSTNEVGPACPGRIGQWLGSRIIEKYRTENPKVTLQELMNNTNAREIFEQSKYRGEKD
jgi:hypothetical protein